MTCSPSFAPHQRPSKALTAVGPYLGIWYFGRLVAAAGVAGSPSWDRSTTAKSGASWSGSPP